MFYGHFEEALQFGHVQIGRRPFAGQAVFLVPHEAVQIQTAAHCRPLRRAQGHAFRTCFQAHAVLQFQVEAAAQVESADCAFPLVFLVQPAVGFQIEFVVFAAHRHAAAAADAVAHAGARYGGVDGVYARGFARAARDDQFAAVDLQVERTAVVGRGGGFEVEFADIDRLFDAQVAHAAGKVGGDAFRFAREEAFRRQRAAETEAEFVQFGCVDVEVEAVSRLAEAAVGFDAVPAQADVGCRACKMLFFIKHVGIAAQYCAG